MSCWNTWGCR